jgi:hypothetical protein
VSIDARALDDVDLARWGGLLDLDTNMVIVCLDPEEDQALIRFQARMSHGVADQFGDGEPRVIRSTVEHRRRDRAVQSGPGELPGGMVDRQDHFFA